MIFEKTGQVFKAFDLATVEKVLFKFRHRIEGVVHTPIRFYS